MPHDDDYCTLNPTKICDNCCRCLAPEEAYRVIHADMRIEDMPAQEVEPFMEEESLEELPEEYMQMTDIPLDEDEYDEDEFEFGKNLPPLEIDPALLAEWEAKLADLEKSEQTVPKLYGVRRKKER